MNTPLREKVTKLELREIVETYRQTHNIDRAADCLLHEGWNPDEIEGFIGTYGVEIQKESGRLDLAEAAKAQGKSIPQGKDMGQCICSSCAIEFQTILEPEYTTVEIEHGKVFREMPEVEFCPFCGNRLE